MATPFLRPILFHPGMMLTEGSNLTKCEQPTCSVDLGQLHDLILDGRGHGHLVVPNAYVSATIQQTLRGTLQLAANYYSVEC